MPASQNSPAIYSRIRRVAVLMDGAFRVPGTRFRFGLNGFIGFMPVAGDSVLVIISLWIVWKAHRLGLPPSKLAEMLGNILIEAAIGWIPLLGDLFDVVWKANLRNLKIIDEYLGRSIEDLPA